MLTFLHLSPMPMSDPNYVDPTLTAAEWKRLYFGGNYGRLSTIRKKYDPDQRFAFPQSIQ